MGFVGHMRYNRIDVLLTHLIEYGKKTKKKQEKTT